MLVDTNIVSYFFRKDTRAAFYEPHVKGKTLFISFITVAELYKWPLERNWSDENKQRLIQYMRSYAVLPFDDQLAWKWAELTGLQLLAYMYSAFQVIDPFLDTGMDYKKEYEAAKGMFEKREGK
jgi:hypothetical protein